MMPIISVVIAEGRTVEMKRKLVSGLTNAAVDAFECSPQTVRVILNETPLDHYAVAGVTFGEKAEKGEYKQ